MLKRQHPETVMGETLPEPRLTMKGRLLLALYIGVPALLALALLDIFVWAAVKTAFGVSVSVLSMF